MPCKQEQVMENKASIQTSNSTAEVGHLKLSLYYIVLYLVYSRTEMLTEAFLVLETKMFHFFIEIYSIESLLHFHESLPEENPSLE